MSKDSHNTPPGLGQWALAILYAALALGAGGASMAMNWQFGLSISLYMAIGFVLTDCAKIMLPMACAALGGWQIKHRAVYLVAIVISIAAAMSALLEGQAQTLKNAQAASRTVVGATADAERARAKLATITETGSVSALKAIAETAKARADKEAECGDPCKGKNWKAAMNEFAAAQQRLGDAEMRDKLQSQLEKATTRADSTVERATGAADTLAVLTGGNKAEIAMAISIAVSIALLIATEMLATFSGDAGALFASLWKRRKARKAAVSRPLADSPAAEAAPEPGKLTQAQALLKLQMQIWHSPDETLVGSRTALAESFGVPKSTFIGWLEKWTDAGLIEAIDHGKRRTIFRAARKAA